MRAAGGIVRDLRGCSKGSTVMRLASFGRSDRAEQRSNATDYFFFVK
jgi:hypothetical protein